MLIVIKTPGIGSSLVTGEVFVIFSGYKSVCVFCLLVLHVQLHIRTFPQIGQEALDRVQVCLDMLEESFREFQNSKEFEKIMSDAE